MADFHAMPSKVQPMLATLRRTFHEMPGLVTAREDEIFPGNDGFSYAFAQCEVTGRFRAIRRGGRVEDLYYSLGTMRFFRTALAQP